MHSKVEIWRDPTPRQIGHSVKEFLCRLNGPTWIDITGQNDRQTRVLVTLLHGNEPSGTKALFSWLTNPERESPLTNISFLVCSVEAALTEPEFSHRYLAGAPDMNRCFAPPYDTDNGKLAENILTRIRGLNPEAVIDMHNTSGSGPDFAVTTTLEDRFSTLACNFSKRLILTELHLGALMECDVGCPIITLECGGSFDLKADLVALKAIEIFATQENLFEKCSAEEANIYKHPLRFEINENIKIGYGEEKQDLNDVTLTSDIEKHNFGITPKNDFLGWVGPKGLNYFTAIDDRGQDIKEDLFKVVNNKLYTAQSLRLFMVTPRPEIAQKDCLFYLVKTNN